MRDVEAGNNAGLSKALIDRLRLTPERIEAIAQGVLDIVELADPVGRMDNVAEQANGLRIGRMQIPLGVIAIIFESRPNVVIDAGALCLKSGNAVILKGGKEAHHSNVILANILCEALVAEDLPEAVIQLLTERSQVTDLLQLDEYVDLVIPRGGEGLIRSVCENSRERLAGTRRRVAWVRKNPSCPANTGRSNRRGLACGVSRSDPCRARCGRHECSHRTY